MSLVQKYHMFGWIIEIVKRTCKRRHRMSGSYVFVYWVNLRLFCVFIAERLHCLFIAGNIHRAVKIRTPRNTYLGNILRRAWATKINSVWTFWRAYALAKCCGLFLARNFGHLSSSFMSWPRSTVELQCTLLDDEFSKTKLSIQFHRRKLKVAHFPSLILAAALIFCCSGVFSNVMIRVWLVSSLIINLRR